MAAVGDEFTGAGSKELEVLMQRVHALLCKQGRIKGGDWSFNGFLPDGRGVRHKFRLDGYERTGPTVEKERAALGLPTPQKAALTDDEI